MSISASAQLLAWLATPTASPAYMLAVTRPDGTVVRGNSRDRDIEYPASSGKVYYAAIGAQVSDLQSEASANVQNAEIKAMYGTVTAAHLRLGLYQASTYEFFLVNPEDLTMGDMHLMAGDWGTVTLDRLNYTAELRGNGQRLQRSMGFVSSAVCPYRTYGTECGLDEADFTDTGTLDDVSDDGLTMYDAARTEDGPSGAIALLSITLGNPTVCVAASQLGVVNGASVALHDIVGPEELDGTWTAQNISGAQFEILVDSTGLAAFVSGNVTPLVNDAGYYGYGRMRFTSGPNFLTGLEREVKVSFPGFWVLQEAFPYLPAAGNTYEIIAGDDHTFTTCKDKFNNVRRNGSDNLLKGQDDLMQVGRRQ